MARSGEEESSLSSLSGGRGAGGGTEGVVVGAPLTSWLRRVSEGMVGGKGGLAAWITVLPWTKDSGACSVGVGSIRS